MTPYPEHDKLHAVAAETQAAGEFMEWLESRGIQLMTYRTDLTDTRPVDPECPKRRDRENPRQCDPVRAGGDHAVMYWMRHCQHWHQAEGSAPGDGEQGVCCYCGKGQIYEVHGISAWTGPGSSLRDLLAEWAGIDQTKIEAEKRAMLAAIQAQG